MNELFEQRNLIYHLRSQTLQQDQLALLIIKWFVVPAGKIFKSHFLKIIHKLPVRTRATHPPLQENNIS